MAGPPTGVAGLVHNLPPSEASGASDIRYLLLELRSEEIPARSRDARGVISVTGRQSYIRPVRNLAKACGEAFLMIDGERRAPARRIRDAAASIARLTRIE